MNKYKTPITVTLFPYTTLFRSSKGSPLWREPSKGSPKRNPPEGSPPWREPSKGSPKRNPPEDRKSTRLNSSHTVNSYAVFCLKKKIYKLSTKRLHGSRKLLA